MGFEPYDPPWSNRMLYHNLILAHHRVSSSSVVEHPTRSRRVLGSNSIWDSDFFRVYMSPRIYIISCCCYFSVSKKEQRDKQVVTLRLPISSSCLLTSFHLSSVCDNSLFAWPVMLLSSWRFSPADLYSLFSGSKATIFKNEMKIGIRLAIHLIYCNAVGRQNAGWG